MAKLIKCNDCGKKVSVNAQSCPKCGSPVHLSIEKNQKQIDSSKKAWGYIIGLLGVLFSISALSVSLFATLMILAGSILAMPVVRKVITERKPVLKNNILVIASALLIPLGLMSFMSASEQKKLDYIAENPEAYAAEQKAKAEREKAIIEEKAQAERKKAADFAKSEDGMLVNCQTLIQRNMKNPKSFDMDYGSISHRKIADESTVSFTYYGTNSFNAIINSRAMCKFDNEGRMIDVSF